jgi:3-isopropylmalate/(R)-2-methylmalate dehydratase large subunit
MPQTLFDKIWEAHEVAPGLIYIDLHLVHEVTSPQAFDGLRMAGRTVRRPDRTLATADHNTPTDGTPVAARIRDELSRVQVQTLERNCAEFGVPVYSLGSDRQGIVHVIGPELGVTQPGMTIVCGDSHTATHGAFGALAFGIGTSEVEHVLATQTLGQVKPRSMVIRYEGELGRGVTAKDLILGTIGQMGVDGAVGHAVEFAGAPIEGLSMEGRMTVCNMTIEGGGRAGMIAPDETTFAWLAERGVRIDPAWRELRTDEGATFDREVVVDASALSPQVTWGTTPDMVVAVTDRVPEPQGPGHERALQYMALDPRPVAQALAGLRDHGLVGVDADDLDPALEQELGDATAPAAGVEHAHPRLEAGPLEDLARPGLLRVGDPIVGLGVPARHDSAVVTGPERSRSRSNAAIRSWSCSVRLMSSRPLSSRCLTSGSMSKPNSSTVCASRSIRARPRSAIARHCSAGSSIGSRPFFVQLLRKMSAKRGEMIASKP